MQVVLFRHGDAGDRLIFALTGRPDDMRPLSDKGRVQVQNAATGMRRLVPACAVVATSPLERAKETAEIVAKVYDSAGLEEVRALSPGAAFGDFIAWVKSREAHGVVIAVGHEPHLGRLAGWLRTASNASPIELKKGGACLLEFDGEITQGGGHLRWHMGPKKLAHAQHE